MIHNGYCIFLMGLLDLTTIATGEREGCSQHRGTDRCGDGIAEAPPQADLRVADASGIGGLD